MKLVDPQGEMLEASWESYATLFANAADENELLDAIRKVVAHTKLDLNAKANVIEGRDTRYMQCIRHSNVIDLLETYFPSP